MLTEGKSERSLQLLVSPPASVPTQNRRKSKKALIFATLRLFLYFWEAGKIVLWKRPKLFPRRPGARQPLNHEVLDERTGCIPDAKLQSRLGSTWMSLWRKVLYGKMEKRDWKLMKNLKHIYQKMYDNLALYGKFKDRLHKMNAWKSILQKKSRLLMENRRKKECRGGGKMNSREVSFIRSCLQKLKGLKGPRRSLTWGEIVHSRDERYQKIIKNYNTRLQLYRKMPLKQMSRLWGQFNQLELPVWLRSPALRLYIWMFNCCLEEAAVQDLKQYPNVGKFFQRRLRTGVRPIGSQPLISPCDGTVLHCGLVKNNTLEQVKGVTYSLEGFLGPMDHPINPDEKCLPVSRGNLNEREDVDYGQSLLTDSSNRLYQCIIYLAPGDYHRFHSPADWNVHSRRHFPGELFSVNPSIARWLQGLFSFNERAVYTGQWSHGYMSMTPVGATNVGSISVYHDQELLTNVEQTWPSGCYYDKDFTYNSKLSGTTMTKGQAFGHFSLGSTIVLLFEAPPDFIFRMKPGQKLKYGQGIGSCHQQIRKRYRRNQMPKIC